MFDQMTVTDRIEFTERLFSGQLHARFEEWQQAAPLLEQLKNAFSGWAEAQNHLTDEEALKEASREKRDRANDIIEQEENLRLEFEGNADHAQQLLEEAERTHNRVEASKQRAQVEAWTQASVSMTDAISEWRREVTIAETNLATADAALALYTGQAQQWNTKAQQLNASIREVAPNLAKQLFD